jgi:uncharacterized protein involved in exopolysaccharide biosynthesis
LDQRLRENEAKLTQKLADEISKAQAHFQAALGAQEEEFKKRMEPRTGNDIPCRYQ